MFWFHLGVPNQAGDFRQPVWVKPSMFANLTNPGTWPLEKSALVSCLNSWNTKFRSLFFNQITSIIFLWSVLPCPGSPPAMSDGGWMWYGAEYTKYKCPNGMFFKSGNYPYIYSNCTIVKTWDPPVIDPCVRKWSKKLKLKYRQTQR